MDDPYPLEPGTKGTVEFEDDLGQIHVKWDNGSRLALIPNEDKFEYIEESREVMKFDQFVKENIELKSRSKKGNTKLNQLKTRLFQHYDMPKGELSTIYGGEEKRKKIVSQLSKEDKKTYKEWLKTPEGQKSLELWNDGDNKVLENKIINKFDDEVELDKNWPGMNIPVSDFKTNVKDSLVDIIMNNEGISEKNFTKVDETINKVKDFCKSKQIVDLINKYESKNVRPNYVAEIIFNEFYNSNGSVDNFSVEFLHRFVNKFTDTEIPIKAIEEELERIK